MPVSRFQASRSSRRAESPPNSAGMLPLRLMLSRLSSVTRFGARETVMPVQSAIGVVALQLSAAVPRQCVLDRQQQRAVGDQAGVVGGVGHYRAVLTGRRRRCGLGAEARGQEDRRHERGDQQEQRGGGCETLPPGLRCGSGGALGAAHRDASQKHACDHVHRSAPTPPIFVNGVYLPGPLDDVRVLELGQIIAGRMCGVLPLEMGRRQAGGGVGA